MEASSSTDDTSATRTSEMVQDRDQGERSQPEYLKPTLRPNGEDTSFSPGGIIQVPGSVEDRPLPETRSRYQQETANVPDDYHPVTETSSPSSESDAVKLGKRLRYYEGLVSEKSELLGQKDEEIKKLRLENQDQSKEIERLRSEIGRLHEGKQLLQERVEKLQKQLDAQVEELERPRNASDDPRVQFPLGISSRQRE